MQHNKVGEQKLFKLFGRFSLIVAVSAFFSFLHAESFADFKKKRTSTFAAYKEENDRIFSSVLQKEWKAYTQDIPHVGYEKYKPRKLYPAKRSLAKKRGPRVYIQVNEEKLSPLTAQEPMLQETSFSFYGTPIALSIPQTMQELRFFPQSKEGIHNFYKSLALSSYEDILKSIENTSKKLNLNDWGKYMLVKNISERIFSNQDESRLLSWFLFTKMDYSVRVGLSKSHVVVMHLSKKMIYATPRYTIDGKHFYVLSKETSNATVYTYADEYPKAHRGIDLSMESLPRFANKLQSKELYFQVYGVKHTLSYRYNKNLIDFMASYPQADYESFFNTPLEAVTYNDIAKALKKHIHTKQASEALNFVLHFVQSAFVYEVDTKQFTKEKVMFAQETLFYDRSDCEDRAVLFTSLVQKLFKIGVVGVKYKDHMATGLYIPIEGDFVKMGAKKFIIADPTYMNASIGQSMPKYRNIAAEKFIRVKQL